MKIAEIKISSFFAEHNIALHLVDHLVPLLKDIFKDSKIAKDLQLHRTKCTNIIKNIIAPVEVKNTIEIIQKTPFSILVDESTDITTNTFLCVLVRFVHPTQGSVHTKLLELVSVDATNCSAKNIYNSFKQTLVNKNIPISNIVGVACDGANVMVGKYNSFVSHLKAEVPNSVVMQCICHSSAIIASKACAKLPRSPEDLIRSVSTYVSGSAKRSAILYEIQDYFDGQRKKISKLADTRWLALHQCVTRMIDCWDSLNHYFRLAVYEDHLKTAETILENLNDSVVKGYFLFLKFALIYFNTFNAMFQSRDIMIQILHNKSIILLKTLSQNFVKPILIDDNIFKLDFSKTENFIPITDVFVGMECEKHIKTLPSSLLMDFKLKCQSFYIIAANEIIKRFPITNNIFQEMSFLDPNIALDLNNRKNGLEKYKRTDINFFLNGYFIKTNHF